VTLENGLDDSFFGEGLAGLWSFIPLPDFGLEVVDMEFEDVFVLNGMGDGVFVEFLFENVLGGLVGGFLAVDLPDGGVFLEDGRAGETEKLGIGEEIFDGLMVVAELGAVALVENDGVKQAIISLLQPVRQFVKTITFDNAKEFTHHELNQTTFEGLSFFHREER